MKKAICLVVLALSLTACGSSGNNDSSNVTTTTNTTTTTNNTTTKKTTTTTTTTITTTTSPKTTTTKETTTTAPETTTTIRTFNTEWYQFDTRYPVCHVDKYVYAAPTRESEQIGFVSAGDAVINIGYANSDWFVIEWNDDIGFMEVYEVYEETTPTETLPPETTETMP